MGQWRRIDNLTFRFEPMGSVLEPEPGVFAVDVGAPRT